MRSLASLLEAAVRRSATEVLLESGQPVVFTTARGAESEQSVLPRTDLFDMIVAAVDDSQQIELAVGNPVEFMVEASGSWTVFAEPGIDGMTVRARRDGALPTLEIELDPPDEFAADGFAVAEASFPDDDDFAFDSPAFEAADPIGDDPRARAPSQLHVEALDTPSLHDPDPQLTPAPAASSALAAPFESGTWALADDDEFGLDDSGERRVPLGFPDPPMSAFDDADIGVPDDDDDDHFHAFADTALTEEDLHRRRTLSPTLSAVAAASSSRPTPRDSPRLGSAMAADPPRARAVGDTPTRRELPREDPPHTATRRELGSLGSPDADTRRELPSVGRAPALGSLAAGIGEGALVYVQSSGLAESLAHSFAAPSITIDDQLAAEDVWARVRGLPIGAIIIVRREDPSALLGWILRRLEEGYRVFVETRARTPEGARRTLLGVGASDRAEAWLDCQVALVIEPGDAGPRVRRTS